MENTIFKTKEELFNKSQHNQLVITIAEKLKGKTQKEIDEIIELLVYYIENNFVLS